MKVGKGEMSDDFWGIFKHVIFCVVLFDLFSLLLGLLSFIYF